MASVVKRTRKDGSPSYHVKYRGGDGRIRWERFPKAKDANARKAEVELALARSGGAWQPPATVRFADYAELWLERIAPTVKPRVHDNYRRELERARAAFGNVPLAGVSRSHVRALVAKRSSEGAAANTIRNALIPLKALFTHAIDDGLVSTNPASRAEIPPARKRKIVPPSREQVEALVAHARPDARDVLLVAASLGLRRGELLALRWADVDFEQRLVRVHATNDAGTVSETTKTEAGERSVPLFESARRSLAARKLATRFNRDFDFVFTTAVGTPLNPRNFERREFKRALEQAGMPRAFRFHDLRHYAVSTLIAQRADIKLLQAIAGHASATMTLDTYGHLMLERVTEAASLYDPLPRAVDGR
jgi:integrase